MKQLPPTDPGLVASRLERLGRILTSSLACVNDELPDAIRTLEATSGQLDAWRQIVECLAADGSETPAEIADMVKEETDATRAICDLLDLPRETRPSAVVDYVRRLKEREDVDA